MRNSEYYKDPTAYEAIRNVMRLENMELQDTVEMMLSDDYRERFKAEYYQLQIRVEKLQAMIDDWSHLNFKPKVSREFYLIQVNIMKAYLRVLEYRARIEGIDV